MNQIICKFSNLIDHIEDTNSFKENRKKRIFFKIQFFILVFISLSLICYYISFRYELHNREEISKSISQSYEITKIYADNNEYNTIPLNKEIIFHENGSFSVIGIIDIEKINISYPILSDISIDALKTSPCRFYGPMPNEIRKSLYCCS